MKQKIELTQDDIKTAIWYYLTAKHACNVDKVSITVHSAYASSDPRENTAAHVTAEAELKGEPHKPKFEGTVPRD